MITWSYGGGVQSVAIGCLIRKGILPKPDLAAIVDTGREKQTTWDYLRDHMQPHLDPIGLKIEVVPHSFARVDLYAKDGTTLLPAYTEDGGRLSPYCSGEWKRDAMERWLRSQGVKQATQWLGFSIDEHHRAKKPHRPWLDLDFPLINLFINRALCQTIIQEAGLPLPGKSRCWMCPHQSDAEWREIQASPDEWRKALAVEQEINANDPEQGGLFLYQGRVPLELADFSGNGTTGRPCDSGNCFT